MSAKRRQEAIQRFSVPLADSVSPVPGDKGSAAAAVPLGRKRRASKKMALSTEIEDVDDNSDDDFTMTSHDEDADDFLDDDNDESLLSKKSQKKGKGKGKGNGRSKARRHDDSDDDSLADDNPKVMLISLKAGALGLNLTVANNVYL